MSILIDESTRILVLGITGREAVSFTRDTLDYGGRDVHGMPVYDTVRAAIAEHRADAAVIAVPPGPCATLPSSASLTPSRSSSS